MSTYSESIGQTPYVHLAHLAQNIFAKHEARNGSYSVKDRVALNMVLAAEADGSLRKGMAIVRAPAGKRKTCSSMRNTKQAARRMASAASIAVPNPRGMIFAV